MALSSAVNRRPRRAPDLPPVSLGSHAVFSGSYSLTTSLATTSATYTLDPSDWALPAGYTGRQYRYVGTFSGNSANPVDWMEFWESRTAGTDFYHLGGAASRLGWEDSSGWGYSLASSGSGTTTASSPTSGFGNGASFNGSGNLASAETLNMPGTGRAWCFECMFQRSRTTAGVETIAGLWQSTGAFLFYLTNNVLTVATRTSGGSTLTLSGGTVGTGGAHWVAFARDAGTGVGRAYLDGTLFGTTSSHTGLSAARTLEIGSNDTGSNRFQGIIDECRLSFGTARYSGSTYTLPTAPFTPDDYTLGLWHLESAPASAPTVTTGWTAFPGAGTACEYFARNRTSARGSLTDITLEVRAVP